MSDILREVEEEVRADEMKQLWVKYKNLIVTVITFIILSIGGWKSWDYYITSTQQSDSQFFQSVIEQYNDGLYGDVESTLAILINNGSGSYPVLSQFLRAQAYANLNKRDQALDVYDHITRMDQVSPIYKKVALIKRGHLQIDFDKYAILAEQLNELEAEQDRWYYLAHEILGISALKEKNIDKANEHFDIVLNGDDELIDEGIKFRIETIKKSY